MTSAPALSAPGRLRTYAAFVRFEHTLFSLPLILLLAVAAVGARTAALTLNRVIDREIDARNPRTRSRELPTGRMRLAEAWALLAVSTGVYVAACAALGAWYLRVAFVPLAVFALYPYLKRFTPLCHAGVGAALALAPLAGFAAAHPDLRGVSPALALSAFALGWVTGFDIIYATLDEAFDREQGVHSMVVWLGRARALRVSWLLHLAAMAALGVAAWRLAFAGGRPAAGWALQRWAEDVNLAFFKTNVAVGFVVLATVLTARMAGGGL